MKAVVDRNKHGRPLYALMPDCIVSSELNTIKRSVELAELVLGAIQKISKICSYKVDLKGLAMTICKEIN